MMNTEKAAAILTAKARFDEAKALAAFNLLTDAEKSSVIEAIKDRLYVRNLFRQQAQYRARCRK